MKRLVLILAIAAGIGVLGLAGGHTAADPVAAQQPQVRRQEIAVGRVAHHEDVGGPAIVAVHQFTFDPGARAGWHTHPGPALIVVTKGEMAFYNADGCRTVYPAGSAVTERPGWVHEPRNETNEVLESYVTFIVPVGPALRSSAEAPAGECAR
jgi:quercetin dioxygenase-like cupin family protein